MASASRFTSPTLVARCTPPLKPFLNVPRPRPPDRTIALMTASPWVGLWGWVEGLGTATTDRLKRALFQKDRILPWIHYIFMNTNRHMGTCGNATDKKCQQSHHTKHTTQQPNLCTYNSCFFFLPC